MGKIWFKSVHHLLRGNINNSNITQHNISESVRGARLEQICCHFRINCVCGIVKCQHNLFNAPDQWGLLAFYFIHLGLRKLNKCNVGCLFFLFVFCLFV